MCISSLEFKAFCIVINFLLTESFLIHFKNGLEYLSWETPGVIHLMRFQLNHFVLRGFLVLLRYSFRIFSFVIIWCCPLPIFLRTCNFPSLQALLCFPYIAIVLQLMFSFFPLFLISMVYFSMLNSIPIFWLYQRGYSVEYWWNTRKKKFYVSFRQKKKTTKVFH